PIDKGKQAIPHATNNACSEQMLISGTCASGNSAESNPAYICQATQLPAATSYLPWWDVRQYLEDYYSGNVGLKRIFCGFIYASYYNLSRAGIGLGPFMRWFYDWFQSLWGGIEYPRKDGKIPAGEKTPHEVLNLQPGELVRIKPLEQILATLDAR